MTFLELPRCEQSQSCSDQNGIELYWGPAQGAVAATSGWCAPGVAMFTAPLDLGDLLAELGRGER
jgi:hypothetical protein